MTFARRAVAKLVREARAAYHSLAMPELNRHVPATISPTLTPQRLAYVQQHWSQLFEVLDWVDDRAQCHQNVIVVRKPAHE